jgi:protein phosphatase
MITAHGVTNAGRVRPTNEDSVLADLDLGLFIVADGMGGHNAGEVASQLAVESITGFLMRTREGEEVTWPYGLDPTLSFQANRLMTSIKLANRRVFKTGETRDEYTGLGTTVVVALIADDVLTFAGVGDSRIYAFSNGRLEQITQDDSWAATILAKQLGEDRAAIAAHPMRHVLTNVVGAREPLEMEVGERRLVEGERLLLCSDGLHGALDVRSIEAVMASGRPVAEVAEQLVQLALERDGSDNISALVVGVGA